MSNVSLDQALRTAWNRLNGLCRSCVAFTVGIAVFFAAWNRGIPGLAALSASYSALLFIFWVVIGQSAFKRKSDLWLRVVSFSVAGGFGVSVLATFMLGEHDATIKSVLADTLLFVVTAWLVLDPEMNPSRLIQLKYRVLRPDPDPATHSRSGD